MKTIHTTLWLLLFAALAPFTSFSQTESAARQWNSLILEAIRNDFARPTAHARNLFHHSIICYDGWAAYNPSKQLYFLGQTTYGYTCQYDSIDIPGNIDEARIETISYASYRFIENRYSGSPDYNATLALANQLMTDLGFDPAFTSTDYVNEGPAALGNYLAAEIQAYGLTDGSNEANGFDNQFYVQLNPPLEMAQPGNPNIQDPNHWQPLSLETLIDQSGNLITTTQPHLSPEWGEVHPFALDTASASQLTRDGMTFNVYFDTMTPALMYPGDSSEWDSFYKWNHTLVSVWQSHLDPNDGVMWDISPASIGNNQWYPAPNDSTAYPLFYDLVNGGDPGIGHAINPTTGMPYAPQMVPRADYARVLAEFWADGIDSETPPGHWYEIYHYVTDQPAFEYRWKGVGPILDPLEYDVKAHLALGGTLHDAAIAAWSLKGYYDYLRPVSSIRMMADNGQSSDTNELNYHPDGIPLMPGYVEVVQIGDPLAGQWNEHVGKIKLFTWRGHDYINDPLVDIAGVGWILAEDWWPYQRPTFVTPPFAGFVSGHSTFSRAAAHTMEFITGDAYFPGGMGEFEAPMNEFLKFEEGPSDTIVLQWATYMDASDQCSLSRIWGGIHPPIDDIPGRMMGDVIGPQASILADSIFSINQAALTYAYSTDSLINFNEIGSSLDLHFGFSVPMDTSVVPTLTFITGTLSSAAAVQQYYWVDSTELIFTIDALASSIEIDEAYVQLDNLTTGTSTNLPDYTFKNLFLVDTRKPLISDVQSSLALINDSSTLQSLLLEIKWDEPCDTTIVPTINFVAAGYVNPTLVPQVGNSGWQSDTMYFIEYDIFDFNETINPLDVSIQVGTDFNGNEMDSTGVVAPFVIDTENPFIVDILPSDLLITQADLVSPSATIDLAFSEAMDVLSPVDAQIDTNGILYGSVQYNQPATNWITNDTVELNFLLFSGNNNLMPLDLSYSNLKDFAGNALTTTSSDSVIWSDLKSPEILNIVPNSPVVSDSLVGATEYFVDVYFDEPMDTSVTPLLMHNAAQSVGGSIQFNVPLSTYLDSTTFRAMFQVIDENIEVSPIDIDVSFAEDGSGNPMVTHTELNAVALDTRNPMVLGLYANTSVLNQWGQQWQVVAVFDEPMRQSQIPLVQLSAIPVNFPMVSNGWVNTTNYGFDYELLGVPSQITFVDVSLDEAKDLAGNNQMIYSETEFFEIHPLLGLDEAQGEEALIYPSILSIGNSLTIVGADLESNLSFSCLDALGQQVRTIEFQMEGSKAVSQNLHLEAGLYYLTNGKYKFKIIVI
ncbi:MAG: hypothetical protein Crog4KO_21390 [Crocinitomicaceae bacterium]